MKSELLMVIMMTMTVKIEMDNFILGSETNQLVDYNGISLL